jgi:hypothetical protein
VTTPAPAKAAEANSEANHGRSIAIGIGIAIAIGVRGIVIVFIIPIVWISTIGIGWIADTIAIAVGWINSTIVAAVVRIITIPPMRSVIAPASITSAVITTTGVTCPIVASPIPDRLQRRSHVQIVFSQGGQR